MKKRSILSLFLALLMFCSISLFSCKTNENNEEGTTQKQTTTDNSVTETNEIESNLPKDLDLGGKTITVLYWDDAQFTEFYVEKATGSVVDDAVFERNSKVEQTLNVKLGWIGKPGNVSNTDSFVQYVQTTNGIGADHEYDIIAAYSRTTGKLATEGYLLDMLTTTYADFDMPWWPEFVIDQAKINDKLYFTTGDISTNMLYNMTVMFYNKELVDTDLYTIVENGEWTLEKMIEITKGSYADNNGNTLKDDADTFGFVTYAPFVNPIFLGEGISFISKDDSGALTVDATYGSAKTQSILEEINTLFYADNDWYYMGSGSTNGKATQTVFAEGRSMFIMESASLPQKKLLEYESLQYGVLPLPKYDVAQSNYLTLLNNPITLYGIPTMTSNYNSDEVSAVVECLAYEGYRNTTPAVFENLFKIRFVSSNNDSIMFDIIRENSVLELGQVFNASLDSIPGNALYTLVQDNKTGWVVYFDSIKTVLSNNLKKINAAFGDIQ